MNPPRHRAGGTIHDFSHHMLRNPLKKDHAYSDLKSLWKFVDRLAHKLQKLVPLEFFFRVSWA
jgi:hypothetical protein